MGQRRDGPVIDRIEAVGQPYVDEAILERAPVYCGTVQMEGNRVRYIRRTPLQWVKPVNGKLVPR